MGSLAAVSRIYIHPIKGLDPVRVARASVLASGALESDRRWAFVDTRGRFINGKNREDLHRLRAAYDLTSGEVAIAGRSYSIERQPRELEEWVGECLGEPVELQSNVVCGFPDDVEAPGPTIVSEESLRMVAGWFGWSLEETRLRFRHNIEIGGVEAFWEDRCYGQRLRLGDVSVESANPCTRCVVPSRDPSTGEVAPGFQRRFADLRQVHFPYGQDGADASRFDHWYRFTMNTRIPPSEGGKPVREQDPVLWPETGQRPALV